jgi:hypothetical protein
VTQRLTRTAATALITAVSLVLATGALAASEEGDAGDLRSSAQDLGADAVPVITGTFTTAADADVYRICLTNGTSFSASTVGATTLDTQLFLFTADGHGVYANDDWNFLRGSKLPANHRFSPTSGGEYYLAISSFNRDPQSPQGEIFQDDFNRTLYPDAVLDANGFGSEGTLSGWHGRASGQPGNYTITLTGTGPCVPPDTTPPEITITTPGDGAVYERGEQVVADYECEDEPAGSGVDTCTGDVADGETIDTSTLGEHTFEVDARDKEGNASSKSAKYTVVDKTPPTIAITAPANGDVYPLGQVVTADYSCSDEAGGSGIATCSGTVADGAAIDTASVGEKSFTVEATDAAGNSASKSVTYTVEDITPPAITLTTPTDGAVYTLGQHVLASYGCEDQAGGSGVAACDGTVANGAAIDTSTLGAHSFEVHASDNAGNTATQVATYSVVYDFDGFLSPVRNPPSMNRWKAGKLVPIRFSLHGYKGERPEADGYPRSMRCGGGGSEQVARAAKKRPVFRYERRTDRYVMFWKTERKWAGTCREFVLQLDDGSVHTAQFQFVKRGGGRDRDDGD